MVQVESESGARGQLDSSVGFGPALHEGFAGRFEVALFLLVVFALGVANFGFWLLIAGDWNFWTDWKDQTYWPLVTAVTSMPILVTGQYIGWKLYRIPFATITALSVSAVLFGHIYLGLGQLTGYPPNFIWPAIMVPGALVFDAVFVAFKGRIALGCSAGGFLYGALFYPANYFMIAPFLRPVIKGGFLMTVADLQGFAYHRSATPEYLRIVGFGGLHTFSSELLVVGAAFTALACGVVALIGLALVKYVVAWPIDRFLGRRVRQGVLGSAGAGRESKESSRGQKYL